MNDDAKQELETSLTELGAWIRSKKKPTRHHARAVLVSLGRWMEDESPPEDATAAIGDRLVQLVRPLGEAWEAAVHDELILACTEHVQSVDPRYLDHPRYDFAYTVAAREALEARLRAASALGMSPTEELLDKVTRADALLLPYLGNQHEDRRLEGS